MYRIGIDIGGTKMTIGLFKCRERAIVSSTKLYIKSVDNVIGQIKTEIDKLVAEFHINYSDIEGVGIGIPGTVSDDGKRILKAPNIDILTDDFASELEKTLNIPVAMVQDSRAAAWGEYLCGGGREADTVVCVTLGTGIGTGIVMNGKIYSGAMGCAGELGHLPVVDNGRECGCGKRGCMEKYCAGGGLDITAAEILGSGKTAQDLFDAAKSGNAAAKSAIANAVELLGKNLVSIINLISPDCLLFSGGLSEQEEMYLNPLINYIKQHCYSAGKIPKISKAELGALSPLYGAAFIPIEKKRTPMLSASIMCADVLNMGKALKEIETAGIEYLHCDIMDNHFVPNMMLPMELLNKFREGTDLPYDYHIMAEAPETIIDKIDIRENDYVSVHYESTIHLQRVITLIKEKGGKASVAINPATPISVLDEILPELDMVLIMSVNPGFAGQKIVPASFEKLRKMRNMLKRRNLERILIEVDGNCSFENVPKMYEAGADVFVVGTSSVFKKGEDIKENTKKLKDLLC